MFEESEFYTMFTLLSLFLSLVLCGCAKSHSFLINVCNVKPGLMLLRTACLGRDRVQNQRRENEEMSARFSF